jgi:hypothetical protein
LVASIPQEGRSCSIRKVRFVAVAQAAKADDPAVRYAELLPGKPLDQSTFYALAYHRHPAAVRHIRQWLIDLSEMSEDERKKSGLDPGELMELRPVITMQNQSGQRRKRPRS